MPDGTLAGGGMPGPTRSEHSAAAAVSGPVGVASVSSAEATRATTGTLSRALSHLLDERDPGIHPRVCALAAANEALPLRVEPEVEGHLPLRLEEHSVSPRNP